MAKGQIPVERGHKWYQSTPCRVKTTEFVVRANRFLVDEWQRQVAGAQRGSLIVRRSQALVIGCPGTLRSCCKVYNPT